MSTRRLRSLAVVIGALLQAWLLPSTARAHGNNPPYIAFWGDFDPAISQCQQTIGRAGQRCFQRALALKDQCMQMTLDGNACDAEGIKGQITAAQQTGVRTLTAGCTDDEAKQLIFQGLGEAKADLTIACEDQADAVMSMVYGPMTGHGSAAEAAQLGCMKLTSVLSAQLLRFAIRHKRRALDQIAILDLLPSQKLALINKSVKRVAAARSAIGQRIAQACPQFADLHGQDVPTFLADMELRGDCVVFAAYVQSAVTCPLPFCGNGVKETGEQCDDGNTIDTDCCHNDCTLGTCP